MAKDERHTQISFLPTQFLELQKLLPVEGIVAEDYPPIDTTPI